MRLILPAAFGLLGFAVLVALGLWQMDRLAWKETLLNNIEARAGATPVAVPEMPDPEADAFRAVRLEGTVLGPAFTVFGTWRVAGAGVRLVVPVETDGRVLLVDLGVTAWQPGTPVRAAGARAPDVGTALTVEGHLLWPTEEACGAEPDPETGDWCGRDVEAFARLAETDPVLVVAAQTDPPLPQITAVPVSTEGIPNNHLGYAIQWFGLALVWLGMTLFFLWRIRRRTA
ncbi:SURF1-like protein [Jannaschia pagri]|uniref:SURF1-like protein n=1 Tax=Jannaschia pagri TaxID=2829797 RepID=A0ABQ4NKB8_9RHOB|nr:MULTISPECIES: SURF1 family protein [unclassified Jannaschia]GIT91035.1 SURF1-like protein [Jannaschia sp. AI_61]GIT94867.1 SURF1-like protein [Jannaschia sp. AI_62]